MPAQTTRALAHSVVDHLYRTVLGRKAEPGALAAWGGYLEAGGSVQSLYEDIRKHARAAFGPSVVENHPLAHLEEVFNYENFSFFTHRGKFRPPGLIIETVNICNNDCVICPYSSQTRKRQTMPMGLFRKIVGDYARIGGGPVSLTPMVGEVFLDKLLRERLALLRSDPTITQVSAITNASMSRRYSDEDLAAILSRFDRISISLYGMDAEEYEAMTRKRDYEETVMAAARILSLAGRCKVAIGARHLKERDRAELDAWRDGLAELAGVSPDDFVFDTGTMSYANWSFFDTSKPLPFDATWTPRKENTTQCGLPLAALQVLSDGTVSFCACANFDGNRGLVLGDAADSSLGDLLDTEEVRRLWNWDEFGVPEFCKTCSFHRPVEAVARVPNLFKDPFGAIGG